MWTATRNRAGYGAFSWEGTHRIVASRASYLLFTGPIPEGREVDHLCRNRTCVNPAHLRAVTVAENRGTRDLARGIRTKNGRKTHCIRGHPFAGDNLHVLPSGQRTCRMCQRQRMQEWRQAHPS
jgi:hypothetical protein